MRPSALTPIMTGRDTLSSSKRTASSMPSTHTPLISVSQGPLPKGAVAALLLRAHPGDRRP